jgi:microcystin-dependent protein
VAEDRPAESEVERVARLERELADLRSTVLVRASRRPTGSMEATLAATPPPDTLLMQGQTVNRADYPLLWKWVADHSAAGFGSGDGSTTFALPDMRGRVIVGAGTLGADTYALGQKFGAARVNLTTAQLPSHSHSGSSGSTAHTHGGATGSDSHAHTGSTGSNSHDHGSAGGHGHSASTSSDGSHSGHRPNVNPGVGGDDGSRWPTDLNASAGGHSHSVSIGSSGSHTHDSRSHSHSMSIDSDTHSHSIPSDSHSHTVTVGSTGGGEAVDIRQPGIAANWLIWT